MIDMSAVLPDTLKSGTLLTTIPGTLVRIRKTKSKDTFGQQQFKITFLNSGVTSKTLYTRDDFASLGMQIVEGNRIV